MSNKKLWDMTKEELIRDKENYLEEMKLGEIKPSQEMLNQYDILIKFEEIKNIISNRELFLFSHRYGVKEKLKQINMIVP